MSSFQVAQKHIHTDLWWSIKVHEYIHCNEIYVTAITSRRRHSWNINKRRKKAGCPHRCDSRQADMLTWQTKHCALATCAANLIKTNALLISPVSTEPSVFALQNWRCSYSDILKIRFILWRDVRNLNNKFYSAEKQYIRVKGRGFGSWKSTL